MSWNPIIPAARNKERSARLRRFHTKAVTTDAPVSVDTMTFTVNSRDIGAVSAAEVVAAPTAAGDWQMFFINTTGGGGLDLTTAEAFRSGATDYTQASLSGAGAVIMLMSYKVADAYQWLVTASHGVTLS